MPKVNSYAPAWLCRPSPGASLFTSTSDKGPAQALENGSKAVTPNAANRTIAKRGNEVFAVIDNEIRWSDLARLKDQWQQEARQKKSSTGPVNEQENGTKSAPYRVGDSIHVLGIICLRVLSMLEPVTDKHRFWRCLSMASSSRLYPLQMARSSPSSLSTLFIFLSSPIRPIYPRQTLHLFG